MGSDCSHEIRRWLLLGRKAMINLASVLKSIDITLSTKVHTVKVMVFLVVMYGWESWTIRKAELWRTDVFELWCWRRLESIWDSKENKPVNIKGNQPWILIGKDPDAGKDLRQKEKRATGWDDWMDHQCDGHELGKTLGDAEGQENLMCCSAWGHKESDTTWWLNNNNYGSTEKGLSLDLRRVEVRSQGEGKCVRVDKKENLLATR